ncbi:MAG: sugar ABC transporter ATP-binding protein [Ignavibacteria bacterium]|nr:sugar ABC transporter ATP-binding protein [Ignavibacteria bacterium]
MDRLSTDIVQFQNISKRFGGTVALDDVSFFARDGEIHAVMGENGAGKSTLMRILSGVLQMDSGTLLLNGKEKLFRSPVDAQREGISTVYQEPYLVPHMSVAENVFLGHERTKRLGVVDFAYLNAHTERILGTLDLKVSPTELLLNLSPAEVQLVQIARAIAFSTRILVLDEPTSSLTEHETKILFELLKKLNANGLTIMYVSHRLKEIFELCHRATVLRDGKYVGTVDVERTNEKEMISMMVGREITELGVAARPARADTRLEVRGLSVSQAPVHVKDVSIAVRSGEIVALAGLVGSGRSEVAKAIFGINRMDTGKVCIDGKEVIINSPRDAIRYGMAFVPEDRKGEGLISTQSIKYNISLTGLRLLSKFGFIRGASERSLARASSKQLEIKSSSEDAEVFTLSGGNQQKVVLAKWLWLKPLILVLDEPTRGIDVGAKAEIHGLIFELAKTGVAVLLVSSELPEILKLADRIYVMRDGQIVGQLSRHEASQEAIMRLAAIGN